MTRGEKSWFAVLKFPPERRRTMRTLSLSTVVTTALNQLCYGLMTIALALIFILGLALSKTAGGSQHFIPSESFEDDVEVLEAVDPPLPPDEEEHLAMVLLGIGDRVHLDSSYGRNPYLRL